MRTCRFFSEERPSPSDERRTKGQGRSNAEIGDDLHMSAVTAKTHVSRILTKLGARDRSQLVVIAYETGLASAH